MKSFFLVCIIIFSCLFMGCQQEQDYPYDKLHYQDSLYSVITERNLAVILVDFPDIPESFKKEFPAASEAQEYFFSPSVKEYFKTMSWGKFQFKGDVFGFFTMPDSLCPEKRNNEYIIKITESFNLNIPGFSTDKYDAVAFVIFHDKYEQGGLSASNFANFTVNGVKYEKQNVLYIGALINDTVNTYTRPIEYKIRYGNKDSEIEKGNHPINWKYNQIIFAHEFIHLIRGDFNIPHANTCTNNGEPDYVANSNQPGNFKNLEYGNKFDIMGGGTLSLSLNGAYRKLAGWCDNTNTISIASKGVKKNYRIYPINKNSGYRVIEIRLIDQPLNEQLAEYPGYFIEVREADQWDATLSNPLSIENTKGLFVYKTDGYTSMLMDMSPSNNFINEENKQFVDYRDLVLKPGMEYENNEIKISNVQAHKDGSFSLDIELKNNEVNI